MIPELFLETPVSFVRFGDRSRVNYQLLSSKKEKSCKQMGLYLYIYHVEIFESCSRPAPIPSLIIKFLTRSFCASS